MRGHPVAAALIDTIRRAHLSRATLTDMIEARRTDLYDDPIGSIAEYTERADRIEGARIALAGQALAGQRDPATGAAANQAGRAVAVAETLRALSHPATPLHMTVPLDLLRPHGIGAAEMLVRRDTPPIRAALADLVGYGLEAFATLRKERQSIERKAAPAFLTTNLAVPILKHAIRSGVDPFGTSLSPPPWRQQWILWRASRKNGVL